MAAWFFVAMAPGSSTQPAPAARSAVVLATDERDLLAQRGPGALRQRHPAVLVALALANGDLACAEVDVLHAQPHRLEQAHPGPVKQLRHQQRRAVHGCQQRPHFILRQHQRHLLRPLRSHHVVQPRHFHAQHVAVEEQQRRQRLVLRRCADLPVRRQVRQEGRQLRFTHFPRVSPPVEPDVAADPAGVRAHGARAVVPGGKCRMHLLHQSGRRGAPWGVFWFLVHGLRWARAGPGGQATD
jgi:hypothetical protein